MAPVRAKPAKKKSAKKSAKKKTAKSSDAKTLPTGKSPEAFIAAVEHETRRADAQEALALFEKITGEPPVMWGPSMIGFGQYHYKYESGREGDMFAVGFSPRKATMVFYVMGSLGDDEPLLKKLGKYKTGRACLYVNKLADIDVAVLTKMIEKSYRATIKKYGAA